MTSDNTMKEIVSALVKTEREGILDLLNYMESHDFYKAPCSSNYHLAIEGGLADHSLNVYHIAMDIAKALYGKGLSAEMKESITICALLHDLGKMGQFDKANYVPNILKSGGPSNAKPFKTNPNLLPIDHEIRSIAIATMFIDLTEEEQFAILYHNGLYSNIGKYTLQGNETPLYMVIHWADMWASRVIEKED